MVLDNEMAQKVEHLLGDAMVSLKLNNVIYLVDFVNERYLNEVKNKDTTMFKKHPPPRTPLHVGFESCTIVKAKRINKCVIFRNKVIPHMLLF